MEMAHKNSIKIQKSDKTKKIIRFENELNKMDKNIDDLVCNLYTNIGAWMNLDDEKSQR